MTTPLTSAQQAQQSNRTNDGKYTTKAHSEADTDLCLGAAPQPRLDSQGNDWGPAFDAFENPKRGQRIELGHVSYGDHHSHDHIDARLSGDLLKVDELRELQELDWIETVEVRSHVDHELEELGIDPDEATDEALYDDLMEAVSSSDAAVSIEQLLDENTPPQLMRMEVFDGESLTDHNEDAYHDYGAQVEVIKAKFKELGLDPNTSENQAEIETMVANGPEYWHDGVSLDVIWSGPYTDAVPAGQDKVLSFKDPNFILIDSFNGSGWHAQAQGTMSRTIGAHGEGESLTRKKRAYLDNRAGGYGWQSIAGVSSQSYPTEVAVVQSQSAE